MKERKLLNQLDSIESILNDYSFEELRANDSAQLKNSFEVFKNCLEKMIFQHIPASSEQIGLSPDEQNVPNNKPLVFQDKTNNVTKLIANVSHEIRTPLNGIIGFTDLLKEDNLNQNQLEKVEAIQTASHSLLGIINELLEYSKLSEGLESINQDDFNFDSVIDNVMYLCDTLITSEDVVLKSKIDPGIPKILKGDPAKLSQILLNLIGNAVKFVEKGEIILDVSLKNQRNKDIYLEFIISDTGIGISQENLKHIFGYFKQADSYTSVNYGGSGLGLSIVKQIIDLLGGTIEVESELGTGTVFKFTLPYKRGDESGIPTNDFLVIDQFKTKNPLKNKKILVFEDNSMNQHLFKQRLKSWECKSYITDDGPAGLAFLEEHNIDLILMDLRMPGMSGFEITEKIRGHNNPKLRKTPIIAVTADITANEVENCSTFGINDFILKPFSPEALMNKIVRILENNEDMIQKEKEKSKMDVNLKKVNLKPLIEECMGELDFFEELVRLFKVNVIEFIGAYSVHLKNEDYEGIAFASHKLKSGLKMVQADYLLTIVLRIEELSKKEQNLLELKELKTAFLEEYGLVEEAIDIELKDFKNKKKD
ncbi:hybrid sensor histidine kinase/response regulator [Maribacter sp. HTCC2170]|uniref:hybrid sensor histidine kinase/response regulator n=1 Tax=Maribacter sp. (strain HTCC2170 / KCCM 42371) TaxID=313603 RepID=UPI00006AFD92|nr:ATP-binding protein [Maribacter sp. HTCC2170]EAR01289.1 two-component system sensory/regulatory protein (hybrid family) [Maribacter sp. HTCC2170]